jgi:hypothetical protein
MISTVHHDPLDMIAGHETKQDEGDAMAMMFTFTMDATNRIIENVVDTALAG